MKQYYGNYLGIVINSSDPEYRGRVQVFVPHIMPAIYEGWNKDGKDIQISCVGSNIPAGLNPEIHDVLIKILPWAEAASPIIGGSAPGNLFSSMVAGAAAGAATGGIAGAVTGAATAAVNHFYNQGPTSAPIQVEGGDAQGLINKAKDIANLDYDPNVTLDNSHKPGEQWGMCARGTAGLDKAAGLIDNNGPSAGFNAASDLAAGGSLFNRQRAGANNEFVNPYTSGTGAQYFQPAFTVDPTNYKPQVGDSVFAGGGGGKGHGHAQKCVGFNKQGEAIWVSDNPQSHFFLKNRRGDYNNFTVYRLNEAGVAKYTAAIGGKVSDQQPPSSGSTENTADNTPAAPNNLANAQGEANPVADPQTAQSSAPTGGMVAGPPGTGAPAGTVSGGGTVSETGISKGALEYAMRIAAAETGSIGTPGSGKGTASYISNVNNTIAMSQGIKNGYEVRGVSYSRIDEIAETLKSQGKVDSSVLDIGYTQHNARDAAAYGLKNSGSYKDQVLSVARHVQNQANKNPAFASYLDQRQFTQAEAMNGGKIVPGWNTTIYKPGTHIANKNALSNDITSKYGGDPYAALEAFNNEYPPTDNIETMLGPNYVPPGGKAWSPPGGAGGSNATGSSGPSIVNNTDDGGRTPVLNSNDMANGMFAYPNPGAMVWVFFREGNPLFPVYFAASYIASEWKSAYRHGSVEASVINPSSAFSLLSKKRINLTDPLDNESVGMIAHEHGSNITMKNGCDFYYSRNNKRDEVDNDRFTITKGYKEEWIQGDSSINIRGNYYLKIGNISAESIAAMQELSNMSYEMNQQLMEKPKGGGAGGSGSAGGDATLPESFQKAIDEKKSTENLLNDIAPDPGQFQYQSTAGNQVPAYLQQGASQATIDQFRADSRALQASRNQTNYIGSGNTTQQGTMTTPLQGPSSFTVAPGQLRSSSSPTNLGILGGSFNSSPTPPSGQSFSRASFIASAPPPPTIRTDSVTGRQFDVAAEQRATENRNRRNEALGR